MATLTAPLKWHGGKSYLAGRIIELMPPRCKTPSNPAADDAGWLHYVEPYFGGGQVMLANEPEGISEVANDVHADLTNFWRVLQRPELFADFQRVIEAVPFSEMEFNDSLPDREAHGPVESAVKFFVQCRQSLAGRMDSFAGISRTRTRSGMNEQVSAWLGAVESLAAVHARLIRVLILNRPALDVIAGHDGDRTLFYLDPPYLHETRATTGEYAHEMTLADHSALLAVLGAIKGRFLLSGYRSLLYDDAAKKHGWNRADFEIDNKAASGKSKRQMTECVWMNF